ncbi:response regulator transcription factor [Virgibacillus proomii]|uniref:response regulator transcription factor n=1 Tax=Virgibacillus proomii TaxID=84407 RepID=UPI001C112896|nr:response regulator transcription factor [Virgibacillus proomii]MBU5268115.1 response regulator transcription factor [Virgibacillus proomii]
MNNHIGIVEDDSNIRNIVSAYLKNEGFMVSLLESAEEAWELWQTCPPNMWILDIMLPGMDGYEFCKRIRKESEVPIIIISAKDEEIDKILGLELGSDDYLTKPFSPRELVARVKRLFKRSSTTFKTLEASDGRITVDKLTIDREERRIFFNNEECEVTTKEFDMLFILVENVNRAFSRDELLVKIWGDNYFGSDRAVDDLVKRIRKKLPDLPLETVWGYGYRLRHEGDTT